MSIEIHIHDGPLPPSTSTRTETAGAVLIFEGIVRRMEQERPLAALVYEDYPPMTERELHRLAVRMLERYSLQYLRVEHSRGRVPVGACSFRLTILSSHRKEALQAADDFIDTMKREVPLWKVPAWQEDVEA